MTKLPPPKETTVWKDGAIDVEATDITTEFDDVLDMLHENPSQQHESTTLSLAEQEKLRREDKAFSDALSKEISNRLRPQGIYCEHIISHRDGYRAQCRDAEGRPYEANCTLDEALMRSTMTRELGQWMIRTMCERILEARQKWFARMGLH